MFFQIFVENLTFIDFFVSQTLYKISISVYILVIKLKIT